MGDEARLAASAGAEDGGGLVAVHCAVESILGVITAPETVTGHMESGQVVALDLLSKTYCSRRMARFNVMRASFLISGQAGGRCPVTGMHRAEFTDGGICNLKLAVELGAGGSLRRQGIDHRSDSSATRQAPWDNYPEQRLDGTNRRRQPGGVFGEGFDAPRTRAIVVARESQSLLPDVRTGPAQARDDWRRRAVPDPQCRGHLHSRRERTKRCGRIRLLHEQVHVYIDSGAGTGGAPGHR